MLQWLDLASLATQTAQPLITQTQLGHMRFRMPSSLNEQRHIAEILDTLSDQILKSERALRKLDRLRSGLLQQLICSHAPDTVLGVGLVGSPANGIYKPATSIGQGGLLVGQTAISPERIVIPSLARRAIVTASELSRFGLAVGDILVSRVFATLEGVGQPALVVDLQEPAVFESNMVRLRINHQQADSRFVFLQLQGNNARTHIVQRANLSNQASISQGVLTGLPFWLPPLGVQREISQTVGALDQKSRSEQRQVTKLRALKHGIMTDLLTGRVRVPAEATT
jgi:type I restriction enzyme S subunit